MAATSEWGTDRRPAGVILHSLLEQRPIQVYDEDPDGTRTLNATDTEAAREKATAMQARFAEWVWEDPDRAARLTAEYNTRFNALVLRDYTTEGEHLALPGLARTFTPRPHQRAAVARMISEPAVGLFHQVGAGEDRRNGDGGDGAAPVGDGQQTGRGGAEPHARTVLPRMVAAVPAGPGAGRQQRRPRR